MLSQKTNLIKDTDLFRISTTKAIRPKDSCDTSNDYKDEMSNWAIQRSFRRDLIASPTMTYIDRVSMDDATFKRALPSLRATF